MSYQLELGVLGFAGFTMLLFQILAFPALINSMGPVLVTRIASVSDYVSFLLDYVPVLKKLWS